MLKLHKAVYGLHQAPVKFKQEVTAWFRDNGYRPANDSETVWIKTVPEKRTSTGSIVSGGTIVHALYADDFLHFTDNPKLYQAFKDQFQKRLISRPDQCQCIWETGLLLIGLNKM